MQTTDGNKIAMAVLGTLTFVLLTSFGGELLFAEKKSAKAGYELPMGEGATAAASSAAAPQAEPIAVRLAAADKAKGEAGFRACVACHVNTKDGSSAGKQGPTLWNAVDRAKASVAGFDYSNTLKAMGGKGEKWSFEALDKFIESPRGYVAGTKMSFAGVGNPKARADLIAYMASIADSPVALPK
ncbi:MAG: c-type cytochrome [Beijerinckiaceae bacterium]